MITTSYGRTNARLLLPVLGWLVVFGLGYRTIAEVPDTTGLGALSNERIFLYRTDLEAPLLLPLRKDAHRIQISTLLQIDRPEEQRGRQSWPYGLQVDALLEDGTVARSWPIWFRGRHSESRDLETSAAGDDVFQLGNDGLDVTVNLAGLQVVPATLRVTTIGAPVGRILVAAWQELPLMSFEIAQDVKGISFLDQRKFANRTSPMPWDTLSASEREASSRSRWQRLSAMGREGEDFETVPMRISKFRESWEEASFDENALRPGQAVAWNLRGPCSFEISLDTLGEPGIWNVNTGADGEPPQDSFQWGKGVVRLWTVSAAEILDPLVPPPPLRPPSQKVVRSGSAVWRVEVPEGTITSVHLARDMGGQGMLPLVTRVEADPRHNPVWGRGPSDFYSEGAYALSADMAALPSWRTGPNQLPIEVDVPKNSVLRVAARMPLPSLEGLAQATLQIEQKLEGLPSVLVSRAMSSPASRYERYRQAPEDLTGIQGWPSEPVIYYVRLTPETEHLVLTSDAIVDLSLGIFTPRLVPPHRLLGFTLFDTTEVRTRYMPRDLEPWTVLSPVNIDPLVVAGQNTRVDAVVRLEPRGEDEDGGGRGHRSGGGSGGDSDNGPAIPTHVVDPLGRPLSRFLVDKPDSDSPWSEADRSRLPATVQVDADGSLQLRWQVAREKIGVMASLLLDGEPVSRVPVLTPAGRIRVDDLPAGSHRLEIGGIDGQFWVDAPGGNRVRQRRVWALTRQLTVPITVVEGEKAVMHGRIFSASKRARVRWRVDGGEPTLSDGAFEELTRAQNDVWLTAKPEQAHWVDEDGTGVYDLGAIRVVLGEDLAPGPHLVEVEVVEGDGLWASFDETHAPPRSRGWLNWQESVE